MGYAICMEFAHETGSHVVLSFFDPSGNGDFDSRVSFRDPGGLDPRNVPEWGALWKGWISRLIRGGSGDAPDGWSFVRRFVERPDGSQIESQRRG